MIIEFIKRHVLLIVSTFIGATGGFFYWKFIGCQSGTCPIKSVWYWSILYGALVGFLGHVMTWSDPFIFINDKM